MWKIAHVENCPRSGSGFGLGLTLELGLGGNFPRTVHKEQINTEGHKQSPTQNIKTYNHLIHFWLKNI